MTLFFKAPKIACGFAIIGYTWLFYLQSRSGYGTPLCYDDCLEYISASLQPDFHSYLMALFGDWSPRPFPVPFIYSLFSISPRFSIASALKIIQFQSVFAFASWSIFSWVTAYTCTKGWKARFAFFFACMSTLFGRHLQDMNLFLLSDSLSMSFLLLAFSLAISLESKKEFLAQAPAWSFWAAIPIAALVFSFAAFARDSNPLLLAPAFIFLAAKNAKSHQWRSMSIFCLGLFFCMASLIASSHTNRSKTNVLHNIAARILPIPEAKRYFEKAGMHLSPLAQAAEAEFISQWNGDPAGVDHSLAVEGGALSNATSILSADLEPFLPKARSVYVHWIASNPIFLARSFASNASFFLNPQMPSSSDASERYVFLLPACTGKCFPSLALSTPDISLADQLPLWLLACAALVGRSKALFGRLHGSSQPPSAQFGAMLMFCGAFCAFGSFFGDFWEHQEMARHCFSGSLFFKVGCLICFTSLFAQTSIKTDPDLDLPTNSQPMD